MVVWFEKRASLATDLAPGMPSCCMGYGGDEDPTDLETEGAMLFMVQCIAKVKLGWQGFLMQTVGRVSQHLWVGIVCNMIR